MYLRSILAFSSSRSSRCTRSCGCRPTSPYSLGREGTPSLQSLNTAVSFVTNTNWQSYSGEAALGYTAQMAGLAVELPFRRGRDAVAVALIRGLARTHTDRLGNFWVDLTRITIRILLPIAVVFGIVLIVSGVVQNFAGDTTITTLAGGTQTIPGGPVARQEVIKELGTNGGGFYNANSAHPFENPNGLTNLSRSSSSCHPLQPHADVRPDRRGPSAGYAILAVMGSIWAASPGCWSGPRSTTPAPHCSWRAPPWRARRSASGCRCPPSSRRRPRARRPAPSTRCTTPSLPYGGGLALFNMTLGEVTPGGTGSGLYGMLIAAIVAVFIAGLMVGRTPEYLGKKIGAREMKLVSLYILTTPTLVLLGLGAAMATETGRAAILNPGAHGLSEVFYAFASASNNNGSAFAGLGANTDFYNVGLAVAMFLGRLLPICFVLALAGSLAQQGRAPASAGTLPTHRPQFVLLTVGVILIVAGLTFVPALALGPLAEGLS